MTSRSATPSQGTPGHEFVKALTPHRGEPVVRKHRSSAFWGTNLELLLRSNGIRTVVIGGCTTEGCVESTARDAMFNDLYVVIAVDCVASDDREQHEASLLLMRHRFDLATADEIASVWAAAASARAGSERCTSQRLRCLMVITDVLAVPVRAGFFADDQAAIRAGAVHDGFTYAGVPLTPGFRAIRQPGEAVSVLLLLDDGQVAHGDCAAVQYSGVGGRDAALPRGASLRSMIERHVAPLLRGTRGRRASATRHARSTRSCVDGEPLHTAIRYGVTQALLDAVARAHGVTMAEVVRDEYAPARDRTGADVRAVRRRAVLQRRQDGAQGGGRPPARPDQRGRDQARPRWRAAAGVRLLGARPDPRAPRATRRTRRGCTSTCTGRSARRSAAMSTRWRTISRVSAKHASPFAVSVEHAVDAGSRDAQVRAFAALRASPRERGCDVRIAVDEWCNTLEDIELFVAAGAADVIHVKTPDLGGINNTDRRAAAGRAARARRVLRRQLQ